jgi:hypothetical protein
MSLYVPLSKGTPCSSEAPSSEGRCIEFARAALHPTTRTANVAGHLRNVDFGGKPCPKKLLNTTRRHQNMPRMPARHHGEAAKHHEAGNHEKAAHHAHTANAHGYHARGHAEEATKAHAEHEIGRGAQPPKGPWSRRTVMPSRRDHLAQGAPRSGLSRRKLVPTRPDPYVVADKSPPRAFIAGNSQRRKSGRHRRLATPPCTASPRQINTTRRPELYNW